MVPCRYPLLANVSSQALLNFVRFRGTSLYNGVYWNVGRQKWRSEVRHAGRTKLLGNFSDEISAAQAYDDALREIGFAQESRLRRLNFPAQSEVMTLNRKLTPDPLPKQGHAKEALAINLIAKEFMQHQSSEFELHRLGEGTYADIIARRRYSSEDSWFGIQIKSTWDRYRNHYHFAMRGNQYYGMLVVCIAIVDRLLWAVPSYCRPFPQSLAVTVGGKWDRYRCLDLESLFVYAWNHPDQYVRFPLDKWEVPRSAMQQVERRSQTIGARLFAAAGLSVERPEILQGRVDMLINGTRVQDKTVRRERESECFMVSMQKRDGAKKCVALMMYQILMC